MKSDFKISICIIKTRCGVSLFNILYHTTASTIYDFVVMQFFRIYNQIHSLVIWIVTCSIPPINHDLHQTPITRARPILREEASALLADMAHQHQRGVGR